MKPVSVLRKPQLSLPARLLPGRPSATEEAAALSQFITSPILKAHFLRPVESLGLNFA
jgi:hypothetical protein